MRHAFDFECTALEPALGAVLSQVDYEGIDNVSECTYAEKI